MDQKRVYLDTVITSGRVLKDLSPRAEMDTVEQIYRFGADGRIEIVKSKMSSIEQERTTDPAKRAALIVLASIATGLVLAIGTRRSQENGHLLRNRLV